METKTYNNFCIYDSTGELCFDLLSFGESLIDMNISNYKAKREVRMEDCRLWEYLKYKVFHLLEFIDIVKIIDKSSIFEEERI